MKIDGIPSEINANHNHNVVLEVQISEDTTRRIKDIIVTSFTIAATTAIARSLVGTANRMLLEQNYAKLYKVTR